MPDKPSNRAADFRFVFANTLGFQVSDNDMRLIFSIDEGGGVDNSLEQVGVAMTFRTAKLLGEMLRLILEVHETRTGETVPLNAEKLAPIMEELRRVTNASNE